MLYWVIQARGWEIVRKVNICPRRSRGQMRDFEDNLEAEGLYKLNTTYTTEVVYSFYDSTIIFLSRQPTLNSWRARMKFHWSVNKTWTAWADTIDGFIQYFLMTFTWKPLLFQNMSRLGQDVLGNFWFRKSVLKSLKADNLNCRTMNN